MTVGSSRNDTGLACTLFHHANVFRQRGHVRNPVDKNDIEGGVNKNEGGVKTTKEELTTTK